MYVETEIWYNKSWQKVFVKYDVVWGRTKILKVSIEGKNITDEIGWMNRAKINVATYEDSIRRMAV